MSKHFTLPYEGGLIEKDLPLGILHSYEKIWAHVYEESRPASYSVADIIEDGIKAKKDGLFRLGLTTGSTPTSLYNELARRCSDGKLSFKNVEVVTIDEYYPSSPDEAQSRNHLIHTTLLDKVDILPQNIHIPDGTVPQDKLSDYCIKFDQIARGLDLLVMGVGEKGQVGFNEAGTNEKTRTHIVQLSYNSRKRQAKRFNHDISATPGKAITMGINTMLSAKKVILLAWGEAKADAVKAINSAVFADMTDDVLAVQNHAQKTEANGDYGDKSYAIFKLTNGKADIDTDIVNYGLMNFSTALKKVILRKVSDTYTPLPGAVFKMYNADMTERTDEQIIISPDSGVFYIGTLPLGTYYLQETTAPAGYEGNTNKFFRLDVNAEGTTITEPDETPVKTKEVVKTDGSSTGGDGGSETPPVVTPSSGDWPFISEMPQDDTQIIKNVTRGEVYTQNGIKYVAASSQTYQLSKYYCPTLSSMTGSMIPFTGKVLGASDLADAGGENIMLNNVSSGDVYLYNGSYYMVNGSSQWQPTPDISTNNWILVTGNLF